jgi:two-component system LytT family response regulator
MAVDGAGIRTAIVEDEAVARRTLRRLLERDPDIELVGEAAGTAAPGLILETRPDLVFLDVQMPGMSGLDVLAAVQDRHVPLVVFVTAHDEYAVQAFELRALDYLLKPFTDARFHEALARAKASIRQAVSVRVIGRIREVVAGREHRQADAGLLEPEAPASGYRTRLGVKVEGRTTLLDVGEVDWIEAVGSNVRVYAGPHPRDDPHVAGGAGDVARSAPVLSDPPVRVGEPRADPTFGALVARRLSRGAGRWHRASAEPLPPPGHGASARHGSLDRLTAFPVRLRHSRIRIDRFHWISSRRRATVPSPP